MGFFDLFRSQPQKTTNIKTLLKATDNLLNEDTSALGVDDKLDSTEAWVVTWKRRTGHYSSDRESTSRTFLSKEGAEKFKNQLYAALKILRYSEGIDLHIQKISDE